MATQFLTSEQAAELKKCIWNMLNKTDQLVDNWIVEERVGGDEINKKWSMAMYKMINRRTIGYDLAAEQGKIMNRIKIQITQRHIDLAHKRPIVDPVDIAIEEQFPNIITPKVYLNFVKLGGRYYTVSTRMRKFMEQWRDRWYSPKIKLFKPSNFILILEKAQQK